MMREEIQNSPYLMYQDRGYSAKHLMTVIFSGICGVGFIAILGFIVVKLFSVIDESTLKIAGTILLFGIVGIILVVATLSIVVIFRYISKPGVQLPGVAGDIERKLGLD